MARSSSACCCSMVANGCSAESREAGEMELTDFKVLTFDCYGTLIDWESGIWEALQPLLDPGGTNIAAGAPPEPFAGHDGPKETSTPGRRTTVLRAAWTSHVQQEWAGGK